MTKEFYVEGTVPKTGYAKFTGRKLAEKETTYNKPSEHNWRESVNGLVETASLPDYDTGFVLIKVNKEYPFTHGFGTMPVRTKLWLSEVAKPKKNVDYVHEVPSLIYTDGVNFRGIELRHLSPDKMIVKTAGNYLQYTTWTQGYLRVMLWR